MASGRRSIAYCAVVASDGLPGAHGPDRISSRRWQRSAMWFRWWRFNRALRAPRRRGPARRAGPTRVIEALTLPRRGSNGPLRPASSRASLIGPRINAGGPPVGGWPRLGARLLLARRRARGAGTSRPASNEAQRRSRQRNRDCRGRGGDRVGGTPKIGEGDGPPVLVLASGNWASRRRRAWFAARSARAGFERPCLRHRPSLRDGHGHRLWPLDCPASISARRLIAARRSRASSPRGGGHADGSGKSPSSRGQPRSVPGAPVRATGRARCCRWPRSRNLACRRCGDQLPAALPRSSPRGLNAPVPTVSGNPTPNFSRCRATWSNSPRSVGPRRPTSARRSSPATAPACGQSPSAPRRERRLGKLLLETRCGLSARPCLWLPDASTMAGQRAGGNCGISDAAIPDAY